MADRGDKEVHFTGATARLRGKVRAPSGSAWGAIVLTHGRGEDMDGALVAALARRAAEHGLWALRFNFAFAESSTDPSGGHADEIADLREAMAYARNTAGTGAVYLAGRGLGAWASIAASTDELAAGAILLGLSYAGQPERKVALERLGEFEIPTLLLVGFESDRMDLPALEALVARMPTVNLEVVAQADHRLEDAHGRPMTDIVVRKADAWLHLRREERT